MAKATNQQKSEQKSEPRQLISDRKVLDQLASTDPGYLFLAYVQLDLLIERFLEGNSKLHDISELDESVERHGFKQPLIYSPLLNGGKGGIQAGNGRLELLEQRYDGNHECPKGIIEEDEFWYVPTLFGVNDENEQEAIAFSITDNLSPLWGSQIHIKDVFTMFKQDALQAQLSAFDVPSAVVAFPVGTQAEDMALFQPSGSGFTPPPNGPETGGNDDDENNGKPNKFPTYDNTIQTEHQCPKCGYKWSGGKTTVQRAVNAADTED